MAQKGLMRILSRKDGKSMVSSDKDSEKAKLTRILEFVPARKPEQAKIGSVVRFMYNPGDGQLVGLANGGCSFLFRGFGSNRFKQYYTEICYQGMELRLDQNRLF